jgi:hypothetical protein
MGIGRDGSRVRPGRRGYARASFLKAGKGSDGWMEMLIRRPVPFAAILTLDHKTPRTRRFLRVSDAGVLKFDDSLIGFVLFRKSTIETGFYDPVPDTAIV